MAKSSATPVLVGVAHVEQRIGDDPAQGKEPLALMIDAVRAAANAPAIPSSWPPRRRCA